MGQLTTSKNCAHCGTRVMAVKKGTSHGIHIFLSVITVGFWIPIWILAALLSAGGSWACAKCGLNV